MTKFLPNPVDVRRSASFNANWLECHVATMFRIWIVIDCTKCYIVSYKTIIANEDASLILELTTAIDEYPLTDMGILSTIGIERWKHAECLWYVNVPKVGEQLSKLLWRVVLVVYFHGNANSLLCHLVHEEVWFATVLDRVPCYAIVLVFRLLLSFDLFLLIEFFLSHQLLHRHFKRIGYCNKGFKAGLGGIGDALRHCSRILTEFVGQPLIVQVTFCENNSYTI